MERTLAEKVFDQRIAKARRAENAAASHARMGGFVHAAAYEAEARHWREAACAAHAGDLAPRPYTQTEA